MSKNDNCKNVVPTEAYQRSNQEALIQNQASKASNKPPRDLKPASLRVVMESYDPSFNENNRKTR